MAVAKEGVVGTQESVRMIVLSYTSFNAASDVLLMCVQYLRDI